VQASLPGKLLGEFDAICEATAPKQFDKDPIGWMRETGQGGFIDEHKPVRKMLGRGRPRDQRGGRAVA
jgi:hypothetical protein